ncbi:MAG TPA: MFS transporter [Microbacteriaceae bacterium]|nr:MFS transporter [Microbacteriaceae bacterium]
MTGIPMAAPKANLRHVWSWALWDWGTSAFSVVITTFVFPIFIVQQLFANGSGDTAGLESAFAWAFTISGVIVAIFAPVTGQRADRSQSTKLWLGVNTFVVGLATIGMVFLVPEPNWFFVGLALYLVANVFYEFAFVNYNTVLVRISNPGNMGRISGFGWGLGYVGGIVALLVVLVGFVGLGSGGGVFGISEDGQLNIRMAFLFTGVWVALFTIPVLIGTPSMRSAEPGPKLTLVASYRKVLSDIARLWRSERSTFNFLIASAIFRDGLAAVFTLGAIIAAAVFGFDTKGIMMFGIAANLVAGIGVFAGGVIEDRIGPKKLIVASLIGLVVAGLYVFVFREAGDITFWIGGLLLSLFVGPTQSASRTFLGRLTTPGKEGELYGLYATTGRGLSWMTGLIFAIVVGATGDTAWGIFAIVAVLLAGLILVVRIPAPERVGSEVE